MSNFLKHHGVPGQKWGVQNGPPYPLDKTVFISGSSKTQIKDSGYYRKKLPNEIKQTIDDYISQKYKIVVGDAPGIDRQVQNYLNKKGYSKVEIYGPGSKVRYSANKNWKTKTIDDSEHKVGSKEWLAKKDIAMTNAAKVGLAVVLDEGSTATKNNVQRLIDQHKDVKVFELNKYGKQFDKWIK